VVFSSGFCGKGVFASSIWNWNQYLQGESLVFFEETIMSALATSPGEESIRELQQFRREI
jgi:hypothetical protein